MVVSAIVVARGGIPIAKEFRVNRRIRAPYVRVIGQEGEQLGILSIDQAMHLAEEANADLVEVAARSDPPVCRIMDYGKHKYEQKKKSQEARQHQRSTKLKEVKLRPKTDDHDFEFKLGHAIRFLEEGNKVKVTMMFRGREIFHANRGRELLMKLAGRVVESQAGTVEQEPQMEGRNMHLILAPAKVSN